MIAYKFRIYPTKKQKRLLEEWFESCRLTYNGFLNARKESWEKEKKNVGLYDQIKELPKLKEKHEKLNTVYSTVLQNVAVRVDLAYQAFFRRCKKGEKPGFPRFKGKGRYGSITFPQYNNGVCIKDKKLKISKIGHIKLKQHRFMCGKEKTVIITKSSTDKWYVCITCDYKNEFKGKNENIESVGIDVGITNFATLSDGEKIENPRFFENSQKKLAKQQRLMEKAKKEKNKEKVIKYRKRITKIYEKTKNCRNDFANKKVNYLIGKYRNIAIEDININKMVEKNWCNKQIYDVSWRMFSDKLLCKAEDAGVKVVKINPAYTSQDCSGCGNRVIKDLKERVHSCPNCGLVIDRDVNAAKNILKLGFSTLGLQSQLKE